MRLLSLFLLLIASHSGFTQEVKSSGIDPDSVDAEMTRVMYIISPSDIKISSYKNGTPSIFTIKLCGNCQQKAYTLKDVAELLLHEQPLALQDLTPTLIKKSFKKIQLGIDRSNKTITYLYLGGINESSVQELAQELSDEY
jgi:hypothetical protein